MIKSLFNEQLERTIIACMLIDQKAAQDVIIDLEPNDFINLSNRTIFQSVKQLFQQNMVADIISVNDYLYKSGMIDQVGGVQRLMEISMEVSTTAGLRTYIKQMIEYRHRRMCFEFAERVKKAVLEEDSIQKVYNTVSNLPDLSESEKEESTKKILQDAINRMVERKQKPNEVKGLCTGFPDLDRVTGGVKRGELVLVSAPPNVGKSVITKDISLHFAKKGRNVESFNFEMVNENIGDRLLASAIPLETKKIDNPAAFFTPNDARIIKESKIDDVLDKHLHIHSKMRNRTLEAIRIKCKESVIKNGSIDLIVVDYLQKMQGEGEERERIERNISGLSSLAKEFNCVAMVISSLTRDEKLKGSTNIEFDADHWWKLKREHSDKDQIKRAETELIVEKNRNGGKGHIDLLFDERYVRFVSVSKF